ncbi:c-type cytochrome [Vreelandella zhanjiangensis]|uniref:c-type cytochrome n=1 Tax=Vreelandella zhanjiangensis TaxID=1121960 RepID=UPI00036602BA|nr:c-type cytochrome [Halomonas zhanjiangensis]
MTERHSTLKSYTTALPAGFENLRYGVVVRPPHYRWNGEHFACDRLAHVDTLALKTLPYDARAVIEGNFVGVVADSIENARDAAKCLILSWQAHDPIAATPAQKARVNKKSHKAPVHQKNGVADIEGSHADRYERDYGWPSRMRWGETEGWVVAEYRNNHLAVWTQTTTPQALRQDLSTLTALDADQITLYTSEGTERRVASGLGRHCGDDAAVDAALMARALGHPVAVWLDAQYSIDVKALGQAQRLSLSAAFGEGDHIERYRYRQAHASGEVVAVGLLLSGRALVPGVLTNTEKPLYSPYTFQNAHLSAHTGRLSGQALNDTLLGIQQTFARESFLDEVAHARGQDPLALRLRYLGDARGRELIESVAKRADWQIDLPSRSATSDVLQGRGLAYAQLPDRQQRLESGVRSAWIADVEVNRITGNVQLTRLVVGQDSGVEVDTARLQHTLQARVLGEARPLLGSEPAFDEWGDGRLEDKQNKPLARRQPSLERQVIASNEAPSALPVTLEDTELSPGVAVIANALFDATGIRFRQPPFTASRVRQALQEHDLEASTGRNSLFLSGKSRSPRRQWFAAAAFMTVAGSAAMAWPWKGAIVPVSRPAATLYSDETIERGRLVAAAGDCAACHTVAGGATNTGGHAFETPFGTLYSTNITPDEATGIGQWSYAAFERAMRHGISRDGRHLYPAFPYTAFAKTSDADLQALYAYLMAQPAVSASAPQNDLSFPFNVRALMAPWNALYHDPKPFQPDPAQSELYNRGAYLAEGLGHCSACHSPRNAMGAEKDGKYYFAGAMVDGWEAPALNTLSRSPIGWSENSLYDYLRHGESALHGVASGPMAPVVAGLSELPEYDVRAIAHYVAQQMEAPSGNGKAQQAEAQRRVAAAAVSPNGMEEGERLFDGACAACHLDNGLPSFTRARTSLALNTNLYSERPDNVIQSILGGVHADTVPDVGNMPGFADSFSDTQVATLATYLRARFAPDAPPWQQLEQRVAAIRQPHHNNTHSSL